MKIQDILRGLLDTLDNVEHTTGNPSNALDSVEGGLVPVVADNTDNTESGVMVPPLQAALELQKREAGVDSFYGDGDSGCGCDQPCDCASTEDYADEAGELSDITRLAGFPQEPIVAITTSSTPF